MDRLIMCIAFTDNVETISTNMKMFGIYSEPNDEIRDKLYKFISDHEEFEPRDVEITIGRLDNDTEFVSRLFNGDEIINEEVNLNGIMYIDHFVTINIYSIPLNKVDEFSYNNLGGN